MLGIYQNKNISVNSITFNKPSYYKMFSTSFTNSKTISSKISNILGLNNKFILNKYLFIGFKNYFTQETITMVFESSKRDNKEFKLLFKNEITSYKNCSYTTNMENIKNDNKFYMYGFVESLNISFGISSNNQSDLLELRNDICK